MMSEYQKRGSSALVGARYSNTQSSRLWRRRINQLKFLDVTYDDFQVLDIYSSRASEVARLVFPARRISECTVAAVWFSLMIIHRVVLT